MIEVYPTPQDHIYNSECECLLPWIGQKVLEVCSGGRSPVSGAIRVDIDPKAKPDLVGPAYPLPYNDGEFDSVVCMHGIEHLEDPHEAIREWLRVINDRGSLCLVVPNKDLTEGNDPTHINEWTYKEFIPFIKRIRGIKFRIVESGMTPTNWSFYVIIKKYIPKSKRRIGGE